jgi:hypothetical protein
MTVRLVTYCVLLFLSAVSQSVADVPSRGHRSTFTLIARAKDHWTVDYTPGMFAQTPVTVSGQTYQFFGGDGASGMSAVGAPQLPVEALTLGVPWGSTVQATLVDPVYEDQPGVLVAPCPAYTVDQKRQTTASFTLDNSAYSQNRFYPLQQVLVDRPVTLRQQRICTIRVAPYLYNPSTHLLRRLVKGRMEIALTRDNSIGTEGSSAVAAGADPWFEDVYKSVLWNYEEAKSWRVSSAPRVTSDSARGWFNVGQKYFRVPVAADGWYCLPVQSLAAAGTSVSDLSPLQLFRNGQEIPLRVRGDSTIEFYGRRNYGDSTYYDFYTDTSTYWLTLGGREGQRYVSVPATPAGNGIVTISSIATVHREVNTDYYEGTGEAEITRNGTVPGEGWVWEYYYPGTSISHDFSIDSIDVSQGMASLRVRLFGTTVHSVTPDHHAQIWLNDSLAGEAYFDGREGVLFTDSIPSSWLQIGTNRLRIVSIPTANGINQFYLDWFEVDYHRKLRATNGQLTFTVGSGNPVRVTLSGMPNPFIEIADISTGRLMQGITVSGDSAVGFTATFQDTVSTSRDYAAFAIGSGLPASIKTGKMFADLRANATGADYIIITHGDFFSAAQRLAAERRSFNGVRAAVADVQDIYDEFNYGNPDVNAIKRYLQFAYASWPAPAPAYLLLFGDASWDPHRYMPSSTRIDFVPAYGVPAGDNWYGCFDTTDAFVSSLMIGRLCVQNPGQATATVDKLVGFDRMPGGDWDKRFMFITGGNSAYEQEDFNATTESMIRSYVSPAPVGGAALRVYKSSPAVIDGEHIEEMRTYVKEGVGFINFLGHSGGRTWGVDIGSPNDLENTNGQLPFVSSVSCNVGAFAEPSNNVLSEDFVLADNRAGIGCWSSSSLGYAYTGSLLVNYFLDGLSSGGRELGKLTSVARYRLRLSFGAGMITETMLNCTPLQGDPLTRFPLPLKPDLGITPEDISMPSAGASGLDSSAGVHIRLHNYGLVTPDSVTVSVSDIFGGRQNEVRRRVGPQYHVDSLTVPWDSSVEPGKHTIVVSLDPDASVDEVTKFNNVASIDDYIYARTLAAIKPVDNAVVNLGAQALTVGLPGKGGIPGLQVVFEIDTVASFSSPFKIQSGVIVPGPVSAVWKTPSLTQERTYFWRARTVNGGTLGDWVVSALTTTARPAALPVVRRREASADQFNRDVLAQAAATDSGVTIAPNAPLQLWSRSYGDRGGITHHLYSRIGINNQVIWGYEWEVGQSFMGIRVNEYDGSYVFRTFDVKNSPPRADSLKDFINTTPVGNYIVLSVIFDGHTNVSDSLMSAIESLGSTGIRSLLPGQSWAFIGRKGYPASALEQLTNDSAVVSLHVPNYYSLGWGTVSTPYLSTPASWSAFHWQGTLSSGVTALRMAVLGIKSSGAVDTVAFLPPDSTDVSLAFLNAYRSLYAAYRFQARLSTADALRTPVLKEWWYDAELPADLAISTQSIGSGNMSVARGTELQIPVTGYNLGYRSVDSARVTVFLYDERNMLRPILSSVVDSIPVDGSRTVTVPLATNDLPGRSSIRVQLDPLSGREELHAENNGADFAFTVTGSSPARLQIFADGVSLMDGDYVAAAPKMVVHLGNLEGLGSVQHSIEAFVDGLSVVSQQENDLSFTPSFAAGKHDLRIVARINNALGYVDSLQRTLVLNVVDEYRVLQVFNFPNPFAGETYFSYVLTGAHAPDHGTIRIFTVAGRKIRQMEIPSSSLQIGVNRVFWDGRDNDGDDVANGYYFYQVQVSAGDKTEAAIGKMVRVR